MLDQTVEQNVKLMTIENENELVVFEAPLCLTLHSTVHKMETSCFSFPFIPTNIPFYFSLLLPYYFFAFFFSVFLAELKFRNYFATGLF